MELCNRSSRQLVVVLGVVLTVLLFAVRTSYYVVQLPQQLPSLDHKKPPKEWRVVATNTALILPDTKYSKLNITYERVFLPEDHSDVFVSVRTTVPFHKSRLMLLLYTWLQTIDPKQVHCYPRSLHWWCYYSRHMHNHETQTLPPLLHAGPHYYWVLKWQLHQCSQSPRYEAVILWPVCHWASYTQAPPLQKSLHTRLVSLCHRSNAEGPVWSRPISIAWLIMLREINCSHMQGQFTSKFNIV